MRIVVDRTVKKGRIAIGVKDKDELSTQPW